MAQCDEIGMLAGIGIAEDGMGEEFRGVGMDEVTALIVGHHEIGVGIGFLCRDDTGEMQQREVGGDNADELPLGIIQRFAVRCDHTIQGYLQRVALVVVDHPAGLALEVWGLVPHLFEVFVLLFDDGGDGVLLPDGIGGEIAAIFREDIRLGADGTAIDVAVEHDDAARIGQDGVGIQVLDHLPVVDIGSGLNIIHKAADTLHGCAKHTVGMLHRFFLDIIPRLYEQNTQRQDEDGHSHQQDAKAELHRKRLSDMSDNTIHYSLFTIPFPLFSSFRICNELVEQGGDLLTPTLYLRDQMIRFLLRQLPIMFTDGLDACGDAADG